ncbi:MAG: hypothetical protein QOI15_1736, partial [Pseudonocardiales bacterium]|nr:hypothetical protein [Pseudonocardiales bacterium]
MLVIRLALRALAWRAGVSATVFGVALFGVLAAAIGPIYLRTVDQTVLSERLLEAAQTTRDVSITRTTLPGYPDVNWIGSVRQVAEQAADSRWFAAPVYSEEAQVVFTNRVQYATQLAAIDDLCAHVRVTAGRCLTDGEDESTSTVVSSRTAREQGIAVGDTVAVVPAGATRGLRVHVVGIIDPVALDGPFWAAWNYFNQTPSAFDSQLPRIDSFFVSHVLLSTHLKDVAQTVVADVRLVTDAVTVEDVTPIRDHVNAVVAAGAEASAGRGGFPAIVVGSGLPDVLDGMQHEMSLAQTLIIMPTVQLVLLAMFVLYAVVAGTTAALGPEVALAKLRGRRPLSILLQGVLQPVVLILLATPVAALLAWLVVRVVADHLLGRHVDVVFPLSAAVVIGVAAFAAVLAALAAARRIVRAPVGDLLRRGTDSSGSSLGLALADAATVTLAVAGLVQLIIGGVLDSGKTSPLSALAPVLLGVAAAIVALRLLPFAGRAAMRWTRDSPRVAAFLAVRQIVRRPAGARVLLPIGIALSLATFALINWSVADSNRSLRALNEAGAATVLKVQPGKNVLDLRTAVDRADPSGQSMAAVHVQGGASTPLLAVDTARFEGVATWRDNYSATPLPDLLRTIGAGSPSITFTGEEVRLEVDVTKAPPVPFDLTLYVTNAAHLRRAYPVHLSGDSGTYLVAVGPGCAQQCRITGLRIEPRTVARVQTSPPKEVRATIGASAGQDGTWQPIDGFDDPARWFDDEVGRVDLATATAGLQVLLGQSSVGGDWPGLTSKDMPLHLPGVLASGTASVYRGASAHDAASFGVDSHSQPIDGLVEAVSVPQLDRYGVMVDYGAALNEMVSGPGGQSEFQVWLSPDAPSDMRARLAEQGVVVTGVVHAQTFRTALDHTGPAFADELFLVAAGTAVLLAVGAALLAGITTARRRA